MVGVGFILSMIFHAGTKEPPEVVINGQSTKSEAMVMVNSIKRPIKIHYSLNNLKDTVIQFIIVGELLSISSKCADIYLNLKSFCYFNKLWNVVVVVVFFFRESLLLFLHHTLVYSR